MTAGSSLIRVDYDRASGQAEVVALLDTLVNPRGLIVDPLHTNRVYLAERGDPGPFNRGGRVRALELDAYGENLVFVQELGIAGAGLPRPEALGLESGGARLLVITDSDPVDGTLELRGVDIGGPELGEVVEIADDLPDDVMSLATGPDGLRLMALAVRTTWRWAEDSSRNAASWNTTRARSSSLCKTPSILPSSVPESGGGPRPGALRRLRTARPIS